MVKNPSVVTVEEWKDYNFEFKGCIPSVAPYISQLVCKIPKWPLVRWASNRILWVVVFVGCPSEDCSYTEVKAQHVDGLPLAFSKTQSCKLLPWIDNLDFKPVPYTTFRLILSY